MNNPVLHKKEYYEATFFNATKYYLNRLPDSPVPGGTSPYSEEQIQFRCNTSLAFPVREVQDIHCKKNTSSQHKKLVITANLLGLSGITSPLPSHYTEGLAVSAKTETYSKLLFDMFNHRLLSLLYRCHDKYQIPDLSSKEPDRTSVNILSLMGVTSSYINKTGLEWRRLIMISGLVQNKPVSSMLLRDIIKQYFSLDEVSIIENIHVLEKISEKSLKRSGGSQLAKNTVLGNAIKSLNGKFRVVFKALSYKQFMMFMPDNKLYVSLHELIKLTLRQPLGYELELHINKSQTPACRLSRDTGMQIGRNMWIGKSLENNKVTVN